MRNVKENYAVGVPVQQKTPRNLRRQFAQIGAGLSTGLVAVASNAGIDVSGVTTAISDGETSLNTVGTAVLGIVVIVFLFFMIRRLLR